MNSCDKSLRYYRQYNTFTQKSKYAWEYGTVCVEYIAT
jgi:uncharacterized membrane protein YgaE (UPF0421/DUF939 family)